MAEGKSMSKCCQCEQAASVHLVDIDQNGRMREAFLCKQHAEACGAFAPHAYHLIESLPIQDRGIVLSRYLCPECGCTREWIEQNKSVGCPHCYTTFQKLEIPTFNDIPIHFGKIPAHSDPNEAFQPRLQFLKKRIEAAIQSEKFEEAHRYQALLQAIQKTIRSCTK